MTHIGGWNWDPPPESVGAAALSESLRDAVADSDIGVLTIAREPASFLSALTYTVTTAMYWQEPDDWDRRLGDPAVARQLRPVAEAVSEAPASSWWAEPVDLEAQYEIVFDTRNDRVVPDPLDDARPGLTEWRQDTLEDERRSADRPDDPRAPYSGSWWSTPSHGALRQSTRTLESSGPVGLHLVEDELGWTSATCWALHPPPGASILEIREPDDWGELVARHPLPVPRSRRHDWWRATGQDHSWVIPDYPAVAADHDAIHLTVEGYLATAGRAIQAGDAYTVLAGWNPDQTWWLTQSPRRSDVPTRWAVTGEEEPFRWAPSADGH